MDKLVWRVVMIGAIVFTTCLSCGELMGEEYREKR